MDALTLVTLQIAPSGVPPSETRLIAQFLGFTTRVVFTFLGTLVVGALLLALAPDFTESIIETVEDETVTAFLWGIGIFVALIVVMVILVITIVGILVAIPLGIAMAILDLIGTATVFLFLGERLADAGGVDTSRWGHLVVGAVLATVIAAIPIIGGLANFVISSIGVGAVVYRWRSG